MPRVAMPMVEVASGGTVCGACERQLSRECFSRNMTVCRECVRLGRPRVIPSKTRAVIGYGEPLKRAHYREVRVNGARMIERYVA